MNIKIIVTEIMKYNIAIGTLRLIDFSFEKIGIVVFQIRKQEGIFSVIPSCDFSVL
jgi:hypothetical protein